MTEPNWARHSLSVGIFEFRLSVRAIWQDKARFALMTLGVVIPSLMFATSVAVFADTIRGVKSLPAPDLLRGTVVLFWLFVVFLIGSRVVSAQTHIEAEPLMLTTVSARAVAGGLLVAETLRFLVYLGLPAIILTGAGVLLFDSPASLVLVPAALLLFSATAVTTGTVFGYAVAWLLATVRFVAHHKTVLGSIASLIMMGGFYLFFFPKIGGVSQASLAWFPIGWFADLAVVGTPLMGSSLRTVGALLGGVVLLVISGTIIEHEIAALWFTEPVSVNTGKSVRETAVAENDDSSQPSRWDPLAAAVKPLIVPRIVSMPIRRVAEWTLLRTRREPNRLMFLLMPVFIIGSSLISVVLQFRSTRALALPVCVVLLPWLAGSLFALNPFGDEGSVLPVTLIAVSGKEYVRGLILPGLVFGLPIVVVVTSIAGAFSPYTLTEQFGLTILGVYLTCVSVTITPAIGMALPRFSAISIGQSREILPPRMSAAVLHMALTLIPGVLLTMLIIVPRIARTVLAGLFGFLPAFLLELLTDSSGGLLSTAAVWFNHIGGMIRTVETGQLQIITGGTLLISSILVLILLYRYAIHQFERYSPL